MSFITIYECLRHDRDKKRIHYGDNVIDEIIFVTRLCAFIFLPCEKRIRRKKLHSALVAESNAQLINYAAICHSSETEENKSLNEIFIFRTSSTFFTSHRSAQLAFKKRI